MVDTLQDLKAIEEDPGVAVKGVPDLVEAEEEELPIAPTKIPAASFGSTRYSSRKSHSHK